MNKKVFNNNDYNSDNGMLTSLGASYVAYLTYDIIQLSRKSNFGTKKRLLKFL